MSSRRPRRGSSCWGTTPTTTAGSSWPRRSTAIPWSSAGPSRTGRGRSGRRTSGAWTRSRSTASTPGEKGAWGQYVRGVTWALGESDGPLRSRVRRGAGGGRAARGGALQLGEPAGVVRDVPAGRGGRARPRSPTSTTRTGWSWPRRSGGRRTLFVGVASGLLDQFSSLFGRAGHALTLDCRSLAYERLPLGDPAPAIVVVDSATSRRLADGMYNVRRGECEAVVQHFQERKGADQVRTLRDITLDELRARVGCARPSARLRRGMS